MATGNPFDLLIDSENDDLSQLIAAQQKKVASNKPAGATAAPAAAKLPSKPLPPAQAVRESKNNTANVREGAGRGGTGRGRGGRGAGIGQGRDFGNANTNRYGSGGGYRGGPASEEGDAGKALERERGNYDQPRGSFRGGRRGGVLDGNTEGGLDSDRTQRRVFERRSGTGRGYEMKREGAGRGNWGTVTDDVNAQGIEETVNFDEKPVAPEKQANHEDGQRGDASKDKEEVANETEDKEPEDNEMTLEEYEKVREEKRKALLSLKVEERKVELDKDLQSMQQLSIKKGNDDVFIKLGSDKDLSKRRENAEKEERAKKAMSINEFLKPADGDRYYNPSGRGRGRGRGDRGSFRGGYAGAGPASPNAPSIADQGQFPTLGAK
ncbi:RGG repeats nuclear RNA binding protein A-like [Dendrobium catenatum]|uniref:RGG repeats nuclear RNA binding protein A-like n=1 Tax=Dendrobium catenatum TaxID=906689 RepID=UPI0009F285F7|nr:RGG repeats nuclear RNA binding protein A-like [Dendrobium catenatum]